ncbi:MAG: Trk system potassium uptake protein TrkA [Candidatus Rifleibacterium amylolyticum]|nr:MAG: Trk system potassium uptake protein TrkA [Candidatus Rifleibacterium amylolyticum]
MKIILVGGGKTLYFLCRNFSSKGYKVVIINREHNECEQLAKKTSAMVICGDGSDVEILEEAGARSADALLAITPFDQDNLIICQLAALKFGISRVIALANDPDNADVFEKLGVSAFSMTQIVSSLIEQRASLEQIVNLFPVGEGKVNVTEVVLDAYSPLVGKQLKDVSLPENSLIAVVIRNNQPIVPRGANDLQIADKIVLITLPENHGKVLKAVTGEIDKKNPG